MRRCRGRTGRNRRKRRTRSRAAVGELVRGRLRHAQVFSSALGFVKPLVGHVQRQHRSLRARGCVRSRGSGPARRPRTQRVGDRRLLRRCVGHLPALSAVVVHLDLERVGDLLRSALHDGPVLALLPPDRKALSVGPLEHSAGPRRFVQRDGQLRVAVGRRPEVGRACQQVGIRSGDRVTAVRRIARQRGAQIGDEHQHARGDQRQHADSTALAQDQPTCVGVLPSQSWGPPTRSVGGQARRGASPIADAWRWAQAARSPSARRGWVYRLEARGLLRRRGCDRRRGRCRRGAGLGAFSLPCARGGEHDHRGYCGATGDGYQATTETDPTTQS